MRQKPFAWIITIGFGSKHGQWTQIDAITIFQKVKIVIADTPAQHACHTGLITGHCAHPGDIVVSPLDIHFVKAAQFFHDAVSMRSPVIDIPQNMQPVHSAFFDQYTKLGNKGIGGSGGDN